DSGADLGRGRPFARRAVGSRPHSANRCTERGRRSLSRRHSAPAARLDGDAHVRFRAAREQPPRAMKCPKCGYLGFEQVDRCPNCGYEFSLSSSSAIQELPVRNDTPVIGPLDDLALVDATSDPPPSRFTAEIGPDLDRAFDMPQPQESGPSELPLFGLPTSPIRDDTPLITKPSPPRSPLAVRRSTSEVPRVRAGPIRAASLDLGLDLDGQAAGHTSVAPAAAAQAEERLVRPARAGAAGPC